MTYIEMKSLSSGRRVNASRSSESFSVGGPFCFSFRIRSIVIFIEPGYWSCVD